jgi:hypothetical protein
MRTVVCVLCVSASFKSRLTWSPGGSVDTGLRTSFRVFQDAFKHATKYKSRAWHAVTSGRALVIYLWWSIPGMAVSDSATVHAAVPQSA